MTNYKVAIIGCGPLGVTNFFDQSLPFTYSFVGATIKTGNQLAALVDVNAEALHSAKKTLEKNSSVVPAFTDWRTMFDQINPDIICVAAGPKVNVEVIPEAIGRKVKGIYCEKPLALSLEANDRLAELEKQNQATKIQVNYARNYETFHKATLDFVKNGGIGNLQTIRTTYNGGVLAVFPHTTALLQKLFDGVKSVSGIYSPITNISTADDPNIDGTIKYYFAPQDRDVNVQVLATGRGKEENNTYIYELEFTGSKGRITILENGFRVRYEEMRLSRIFASSGQTHPYETTHLPLELKADHPREFMIDGMYSLINAIETGKDTDCNLRCALAAEEVAHALALSAAQQGQIVHLPLEDRAHAFANARAGVNVLREQAGLR